MDVTVTNEYCNTALHQPKDCESNLLFQVLQYSQVSETVLKYLCFKDCQELKLCCKFLLNAIRISNVFSETACLIISKESWESGLLSKTPCCDWRNVKVELSWLPQETTFNMKNILKSTTTLKVQLSVDPMEKMLERKLNFHLTSILEFAVDLKSLWLDPSIMQWILHDTFSNVKVQECFMKLRELHIAKLPAHRLPNVEEFCEEEEPFPRNIYQLSLMPTSLQVFRFVAQDYPSEKDAKFNSFVPNIILMSQKTLVNLTISLDPWTLKTIQSILLPSLKSLSVNAVNCVGEEIDGIIRSQPLLNALFIRAYTFSSSLIDSIAARSNKLKTLHLHCEELFPCFSQPEWNFLVNLTALKDFNLSTESSNMNLVTILQKLPHSLKKVALKGIHENNETLQLIIELSKFPHLVELSLLECTNAINNDVLDYICYHMKQLTILEFSMCPNVTDEGLSGFRDSVYMGVSIQDLRGLKKLTIRNCSQLTAYGLKNIKFAYLKSLDISGIKISEEAMREIAACNPCLETFIASIEGNLETEIDQNPFYLYSIKDRMNSANRRTIVEIVNLRNQM